MPKFNIGDKVRNVRPTIEAWRDAEGIVTGEENDLTILTLTTPGGRYHKIGQEARLTTSQLDLVEPVAPEFKPGDIVEFAEEGNQYWTGGKAEVVTFPGVKYRSHYVDVRIINPVPLNKNYGPLDVVSILPENLKHIEPEKTCTMGFDWCDCAVEEETPIESPGGILAVVDEALPEAVNHPAHYGGDTTYEVIKVAEAWGLDKDAYLFNVLKYIARAGKKGSKQEDLEKADFYIKRRIDNPLEEAK